MNQENPTNDLLHLDSEIGTITKQLLQSRNIIEK